MRCIGKVELDYLKKLEPKERKFVATKIDTSERRYKKNFADIMEGMNREVIEKLY
ncbi:hypothetical protein VSU01S_22710 [Vibrio superstes NBRC 103154]|uniref:Uncharacterized protein n=1 Tax=Vibrio superstes NBRC 103154 TaxID=1219062 RepID=A0A511QT62_9VIBR|nr:hypothetical protein VSU01S_22710 [Vibrio superstes NBRC 103154]